MLSSRQLALQLRDALLGGDPLGGKLLRALTIMPSAKQAMIPGWERPVATHLGIRAGAER